MDSGSVSSAPTQHSRKPSEPTMPSTSEQKKAEPKFLVTMLQAWLKAATPSRSPRATRNNATGGSAMISKPGMKHSMKPSDTTSELMSPATNAGTKSSKPRKTSPICTAAYAPFFQAVFASKSLNIKSFADLAGKTVAVTRGAMEDQELAKVAPPGVDVKRFEDHAASIAAFVSGQTQAIATSASTAGTIMVKNPNLATEYKLLLKDSPNFIGVAKGEDKLRLRVNEIIAEARKSGDIDKLSSKWLGRPAGDLPL